MIAFVKGWIMSVLMTVIFMALVDMILPNNNFKKYAKLATGLIVIITILTPVFKLFDRKASIETYIYKYTNSLNSSYGNIDKNKIDNNTMKNTINVFKDRLKTTIEQKIYDSTGKKYNVTSLEIVEDAAKNDFGEIKYVELRKGINESEIKPVERVTIGQNQSFKELPGDEKILNMLKNEFNIDSSQVKFVK